MERPERGWHLRASGLELNIHCKTGCVSRLGILGTPGHVWSAYHGDVMVRDDRLEPLLGTRHLDHLRFEEKGRCLTVRKRFRFAPSHLTETYRVGDDVLAWDATVSLDAGEFRSCATCFALSSPQPIHGVEFWVAREGMPSAPHRFVGIDLECGEVTSNILLPALWCGLPKSDAGLLLVMPLDFRTPRFRFVSTLREPDLAAEFDWLALAPGRPARASLLLHAGGGNWRPSPGWLYDRYREYFEPRSTLIHRLWGGHVAGGCDVSAREARAMAKLGLRWHEIHGHFPAGGNCHSGRTRRWKTGHHPKRFTRWIVVNMIRRTIRRLHAVGAAALPYLQVTGDGAARRLPARFNGCRARDRHGAPIYSEYYDVYQMHSEPSLPFGREITRQIDGMIARYPEMDGVFLDQACYNFLETAHDDGIAAADNRPAYMQGFNYFPHLEHLSSLLHPAKVIIANGPFGIGIMKYIDGFMAEASGWLCDQFQYYGLAKPMFFLVYQTSDRDLEQMFQRCLVYGAGFSSYPPARASKDLYDKYVPLLARLYRRCWVFDPNPVQIPTACRGNRLRSERGKLIASLVSSLQRLPGRPAGRATVAIRAPGTEAVKQITLHLPGAPPAPLRFGAKDGEIQFDVPGNLAAGVVELS